MVAYALRVLVIGTPSDADMVRLSLLQLNNFFPQEPSITQKKTFTVSEQEWFDIIVIKNNREDGLVQAGRLPAECKCRTVILWNERILGQEEGYAKLGFQYFATIQNVGEKILGVLDQLFRPSAA